MQQSRKVGVAMGVSGLLVAASFGTAAAQELTPVSVVLQWVPQAQFAGYYAAKAQGFWEAQGLDVTIVDGGPDIAPQLVGSDPAGPEFATSWVPRVLAVRDPQSDLQSDLVNIGQVFQRSGTLSVSWAPGAGPDPVSDALIDDPSDFAGKKVGVWDFGNEFEVIAAATAAGLTQGEDFERVIQAFDMSALLNREIDVAEAMIYNEYAQVLETINPKTGELYQPEDLVIIDYNEVGTAMLQDAIHARASWLAEEGNEEIAVKFLAGAFQGWAYCRDNPEDCVQYTVDAGSTLGLGHQRWMMNEINALIWPSPEGIGSLPMDTWDTTVQIMLDAGLISEPPAEGAYRTDLSAAARDLLEGVDLVGEGFTKGTVEVTEGGE
jgi:NitT/TauT family transport system substrate-binding protein